MRHLRPITPALILLFLLSSTAGLVAHEHTTAAPAAGYECSSDHQGEAEHASSNATGLRSGAEQHRHLCVGCQLGGHRSLIVPALALASASDLESDATFRYASEPRALRLPASQTLRGPPRC